MNVKDILKEYEKAVVIAHYRPDAQYNGGQAPQNPACFLQVTLLVSKISPSGRYIRLGDTSADEIVGWTSLDSLEVVELLGELSEDGKTVIPIVPRGAITLEAA